jgi:hypothetical protein
MRRPFSIVVAVFILISPSTASPRTRLKKGNLRCPDEIATTGYYRNYSYGFSIKIPQGLKGFWNSARCVKDKNGCVCMGDHGRFIPIDKLAFIEVSVDPQNYETSKETINGEIDLTLQAHKEKKEDAGHVVRTASRLGRVLATRLRLRSRQVPKNFGEANVAQEILRTAREH